MKMFVGSGFTARLAKPMATSPALQTSRGSRYINSSIYMPELSYLNRSKRGHWMHGRQFDRFFHVRTIDQFVAGESFIELNDWSIGKRAFAATNADSLGLTDGAKPATGYTRATTAMLSQNRAVIQRIVASCRKPLFPRWRARLQTSNTTADGSCRSVEAEYESALYL
jgi:hypothetical protein